MQRIQQLPVKQQLTFKRIYLRVSLLDQVDKSVSHCRALCSKGAEVLVSICKIGAGSGIACSLGVGGGGGADVVLQAADAVSVSSAGSFQSGNFLCVGMGVFLLLASVPQQRTGFFFYSCLRLLGLRLQCFCMGFAQLG